MTPQERYRCLYFPGNVSVFLHERFEVSPNRSWFIGRLLPDQSEPELKWTQIVAVVDNGLGPRRVEFVRIKGATILVDARISKASFEALLKAAT